jgi:hypothetical protein
MGNVYNGLIETAERDSRSITPSSVYSREH